jgi:hypothetical protein
VKELIDRLRDDAQEAVGQGQHVFQKKSKRGIATPRHEMKLVEKRLAQVVELEKPSRKT